MKTDLTGFPINMAKPVSSRMDLSPDVVAQGFGKSGGSEKAVPLFQSLYRKVASMNRQASSAPARSMAEWKPRLHENDNDFSSAPWLANPTHHQPDPVDHHDSSNIPGLDDKDDDDGSGSKIIRKALRSASSALGLSIDPQLDQLSIAPSAESAGELAEILSNLKNIAGLLDKAAAANQGLMNGNMQIGPEDAKKLAVLLHSQIFQIEVGTSMLGISGPVQSDLAQKMSTSFTDGIPQASDPNMLSMPQSHLSNVFSQNGQQGDMAELLQKIADLCGNNQPQVNVVATPGGQGGTDAGAGNGNGGSPAELLRLLALKPGKPAEVAGELQTDTAFPTFGMNATAASAITGTEATVKPAAPSGLNESVMNQLSEKINLAVKQGISEIKIQLRPESLGEVQIKIRVQGDVVFARMEVESHKVQQIVENTMQQLKDALSQQHLQTGGIEVGISDGRQNGDRENASADRATAGNDDSIPGAGESADITAQIPDLGQETGRRFGYNSVEYFA